MRDNNFGALKGRETNEEKETLEVVKDLKKIHNNNSGVERKRN